MKQNIEQLLTLAIEASLVAGKEILEIYNSKNFEVQLKSDNSPLTIADQKAHDLICERLDTTRLPILSEEGRAIPYKERKQWDTFWLVDPLDGTKEFIKRNDEFTVNIALIKDQKPVLGVIYVPVLKQLYFAEENIGSYKLDNTDTLTNSDINLDDLINKSHKLPLKKEHTDFIVVGSRSHLSEETVKYVDQLKQQHGEVKFLSKGSSLKLCMVAEGKADIYPRFSPTMEWDTGAGHAIAECAGYSMAKSEDNNPVIYNKENLLNPWFILKK